MNKFQKIFKGTYTQFVILFILIIPHNSLNAQGLEWAKSVGGESYDSVNNNAIDEDGNSYVIGSFYGTVDLDPGPNSDIYTSVGEDDTFIQKFAPNGDLIWVRVFGGTGRDFGLSIVIDNDGNIYTTGSFAGTADYNPGNNVATLVSTGSRDIFIQKLTSEGDFIWVKSFGGTGLDQGNFITLDDDGNIYVSGRFEETIAFDSLNTNSFHSSHGNWDIFNLKLDENGNFLWVNTIGGIGYDDALSIAFDNNGAIFIVGFFEEEVDFDSTSDSLIIASKGATDYYLQKFSSDGELIWTKTFGGVGNDWANDLFIDDNDKITLVGHFENIVDFNDGVGINELTSTGGNDMFIQRIDTDGNFIWVKSMGGVGMDRAISIAAKQDDKLYITGFFEEEVDFDSGSADYTLSSNGLRDCFVLALTYSGDFVWCISFGATGLDVGTDINLDESNNLFITGYFEETIDLDPSIEEAFFVSNGVFDGFIEKLKLPTIINATNVPSDNLIDVFPNPVASILIIELGKEVNYANIQLLSNTGKTVLSKKVSSIEKLELNLENIEKGLYHLFIKTDQRKISYSLIKI